MTPDSKLGIRRDADWIRLVGDGPSSPVGVMSVVGAGGIIAVLDVCEPDRIVEVIVPPPSEADGDGLSRVGAVHSLLGPSAADLVASDQLRFYPDRQAPHGLDRIPVLPSPGALETLGRLALLDWVRGTTPLPSDEGCWAVEEAVLLAQLPDIVAPDRLDEALRTAAPALAGLATTALASTDAALVDQAVLLAVDHLDPMSPHWAALDVAARAQVTAAAALEPVVAQFERLLSGRRGAVDARLGRREDERRARFSVDWAQVHHKGVLVPREDTVVLTYDSRSDSLAVAVAAYDEAPGDPEVWARVVDRRSDTLVHLFPLRRQPGRYEATAPVSPHFTVIDHFVDVTDDPHRRWRPWSEQAAARAAREGFWALAAERVAKTISDVGQHAFAADPWSQAAEHWLACATASAQVGDPRSVSALQRYELTAFASGDPVLNELAAATLRDAGVQRRSPEALRLAVSRVQATLLGERHGPGSAPAAA